MLRVLCIDFLYWIFLCNIYMEKSHNKIYNMHLENRISCKLLHAFHVKHYFLCCNAFTCVLNYPSMIFTISFNRNVYVLYKDNQCA